MTFVMAPVGKQVDCLRGAYTNDINDEDSNYDWIGKNVNILMMSFVDSRQLEELLVGSQRHSDCEEKRWRWTDYIWNQFISINCLHKWLNACKQELIVPRKGMLVLRVVRRLSLSCIFFILILIQQLQLSITLLNLILLQLLLFDRASELECFWLH